MHRIDTSNPVNHDPFGRLSASDAILLNLVVPDGPDDTEARRANQRLLDLCAGQPVPADQLTA